MFKLLKFAVVIGVVLLAVSTSGNQNPYGGGGGYPQYPPPPPGGNPYGNQPPPHQHHQHHQHQQHQQQQHQQQQQQQQQPGGGSSSGYAPQQQPQQYGGPSPGGSGQGRAYPPPPVLGYPGSGGGSMAPYGRGPPPSQQAPDAGAGGFFSKLKSGLASVGAVLAGEVQGPLPGQGPGQGQGQGGYPGDTQRPRPIGPPPAFGGPPLGPPGGYSAPRMPGQGPGYPPRGPGGPGSMGGGGMGQEEEKGGLFGRLKNLFSGDDGAPGGTQLPGPGMRGPPPGYGMGPGPNRPFPPGPGQGRGPGAFDSGRAPVPPPGMGGMGGMGAPPPPPPQYGYPGGPPPEAPYPAAPPPPAYGASPASSQFPYGSAPPMGSTGTGSGAGSGSGMEPGAQAQGMGQWPGGVPPGQTPYGEPQIFDGGTVSGGLGEPSPAYPMGGSGVGSMSGGGGVGGGIDASSMQSGMEGGMYPSPPQVEEPAPIGPEPQMITFDDGACTVLILKPLEFHRKKAVLAQGGSQAIQVFCDFEHVLTHAKIPLTLGDDTSVAATDPPPLMQRTVGSGELLECAPGALTPLAVQQLRAVAADFALVEDADMDEAHFADFTSRCQAVLARDGALHLATVASATRDLLPRLGMRDGWREALQALALGGVPTFVFSSGHGDVVAQAFLQEGLGDSPGQAANPSFQQPPRSLPQNLRIISNFFRTAPDGTVRAFSAPVVHERNKNATTAARHMGMPLPERPHALVFGSHEDDIAMTEGAIGVKEQLSIGFLELADDLPQRLPTFLSTFDAVVLGESNFQYARAIIEDILGMNPRTSSTTSKATPPPERRPLFDIF